MLDTDSKMTMHARGIGRLSMDYAKGVDVLSIFRFLSTAVIRGKAAGEHAAAGAIVHDPASAGGGGAPPSTEEQSQHPPARRESRNGLQVR